MGKVHLITGYRGEEHIQSADQGSFNASFFGGGEYVMEAGNQLEASIMDNNTVRILDGDLLMQGRHIRIEPETYEDITITTGTAGVNRIDLIVMQYSKDTSTDIESAGLVVIKGTETEGTAVEPAYTSGNILSGATLNQMPLYRVKVEGVVLTEIEPLFTVIPTYKTLAEQYAAQFEATINALKSANILDTVEEIEANTQENMIAGALALKELKSKYDVRRLNNVNVLEVTEKGVYYVENPINTPFGAAGYLFVNPHPTDQNYRTICWIPYASNYAWYNTLHEIWTGWLSTAPNTVSSSSELTLSSGVSMWHHLQIMTQSDVIRISMGIQTTAEIKAYETVLTIPEGKRGWRDTALIVTSHNGATVRPAWYNHTNGTIAMLGASLPAGNYIIIGS